MIAAHLEATTQPAAAAQYAANAASTIAERTALGVSRELVNDLLRTGQLRSVKAGRRHLDEFPAGDTA
jgi:hypothetical protein